MRGFTVILGFAMLLVALVPQAAAHQEFNPRTGANDVDHHHPDCEIDQPAAGSDPETGEGGLTGGPVFVCEGEHWDGDDHARSSGSANEADAADPQNAVVSLNDGPGDEPPAGASDPLHVRASTSNADGNNHAYAHVGILLVGETAVAVDEDADNNFARVAWYGEDWTDLIVIDNVLARPISAAGITRGHVADGDCDYELYEQTRDVRACGRDNTAITVQLQG